MRSFSYIIAQKQVISLTRTPDRFEDLYKLIVMPKNVAYVEFYNYQQF